MVVPNWEFHPGSIRIHYIGFSSSHFRFRGGIREYIRTVVYMSSWALLFVFLCWVGTERVLAAESRCDGKALLLEDLS
jgi:hypothetical protein